MHMLSYTALGLLGLLDYWLFWGFEKLYSDMSNYPRYIGRNSPDDSGLIW